MYYLNEKIFFISWRKYPVKWFIILCIFLSGCQSRPNLAPVVELQWHPHQRWQQSHTVKSGETLYAIAFRYDKDYRTLANFNHLKPPYRLLVGQTIRIYPQSAPIQAKKRVVLKNTIQKKSTIINQRSVSNKPLPRFSLFRNQKWQWPVNGRIASGFYPQLGKKGIDIAGRKGETIKAASDGIVAYAGSGLSGYGNLIIIKHNNQFLTAYGNNQRNLVHEGQNVKAGQIIAEMGIIDRKFWGVHFEIRKAGVPVNPLNYLKG